MRRSLVTIDCEFVRPQVAAAYLVHDGERAAFIDTNTAHAVPRLLRALEHEGLAPAQVEYVVVTHVHLDHAGGCAALADACPRATVLAHPRALEHLADPARLVESARRVYGARLFEEWYGSVAPVPAERLRSVADGEEVLLGQGALRFFHTRGHANNHVCILDPLLDAVFTGDAFGVSYPALQTRGRLIFPSTSPTAFDPVAARAGIARVARCGASRAFLAHFGEVGHLDQAAVHLGEHLDCSEAILDEAARPAMADADIDAFCRRELERRFDEVVRRRREALGHEEKALLSVDFQLNAAGIAHAARRRRAARETPPT